MSEPTQDPLDPQELWNEPGRAGALLRHLEEPPPAGEWAAIEATLARRRRRRGIIWWLPIMLAAVGLGLWLWPTTGDTGVTGDAPASHATRAETLPAESSLITKTSESNTLNPSSSAPHTTTSTPSPQGSNSRGLSHASPSPGKATPSSGTQGETVASQEPALRQGQTSKPRPAVAPLRQGNGKAVGATLPLAGVRGSRAPIAGMEAESSPSHADKRRGTEAKASTAEATSARVSQAAMTPASSLSEEGAQGSHTPSQGRPDMAEARSEETPIPALAAPIEAPENRHVTRAAVPITKDTTPLQTAIPGGEYLGDTLIPEQANEIPPLKPKRPLWIGGVHALYAQSRLKNDAGAEMQVTSFAPVLGVGAFAGAQKRVAQRGFVEVNLALSWSYLRCRAALYGDGPATYTAGPAPGVFIGTPSRREAVFTAHQVVYGVTLHGGLISGSGWQLSAGPSMGIAQLMGLRGEGKPGPATSMIPLVGIQVRVRRELPRHWFLEGSAEAPAPGRPRETHYAFGYPLRGQATYFRVGVSKGW